jgi:hypothetical protein
VWGGDAVFEEICHDCIYNYPATHTGEIFFNVYISLSQEKTFEVTP